MQEQAIVVVDTRDLVAIREIAWNLPNSRCYACNTDESIANVCRPTSTDAKPGTQRTLAQECNVTQGGAVVIGTVIKRSVWRHDSSGLRCGPCKRRGVDMIAVDAKIGAAEQVQSCAGAPSCQGAQLKANEVVRYAIAIVEIVRTVVEIGVRCTCSVFERILESEPSKATKHVET